MLRAEKVKPTVLDLFCGAGGLSEGFRQAGFHVLAGIDLDYDSVHTFMHNHKHAIGVNANIQDITNEELVKIIGNSTIDVVIGSPPCQGFTNIAMPKLRSLGESRRVNTQRNRLYKEFIRVVSFLNPKFFVMENVRGMLTIENGRIQRDIYRILGERYTINILFKNAVDYGVPQHRKRIFFVGNRIGIPNPNPKPSHIEPRRNDGIGTRGRPYVTVKDAIGDLPRLKIGKGNNVRIYGKEAKSEYQVQRRRGSKKLFHHFARRHCDSHLALIKMLKAGDWSTNLPRKIHPYRMDIFQDRIKRQRWRTPSSTIIAHIHKDGLMFIHPGQNRTFTPREAARLQSFNDKYFFVGRQTSIFKQIGNAVPPLMSKAIARETIKLLRHSEPLAVYNRK